MLVPFALVSAGTAAVARKLPDRYYSEAIVRVVPQQVPDQYVRSQQTESIEDRLKRDAGAGAEPDTARAASSMS